MLCGYYAVSTETQFLCTNAITVVFKTVLSVALRYNLM
jgi:hypothetical protein